MIFLHGIIIGHSQNIFYISKIQGVFLFLTALNTQIAIYAMLFFLGEDFQGGGLWALAINTLTLSETDLKPGRGSTCIGLREAVIAMSS